MNESTNQQMRFCGNCGAQMPVNAPYCPNCGHPSIPQQTQQASQQQYTQQTAQPYQPQYLQQGYPQQYQQPYQQQYPQQYQQPMYAAGYQQPRSESNGLGTAGFVLAILSVVLCWVPFLNIILVVLALVFSLVGCFKEPRGLAIAGTVITVLLIVISIIAYNYASRSAEDVLEQAIIESLFS